MGSDGIPPINVHPFELLNTMRGLYPSQCLFDLMQLLHTGFSSPHFILRFLQVMQPVLVLFLIFRLANVGPPPPPPRPPAPPEDSGFVPSFPEPPAASLADPRGKEAPPRLSLLLLFPMVSDWTSMIHKISLTACRYSPVEVLCVSVALGGPPL
jgi:hypothetical protein